MGWAGPGAWWWNFCRKARQGKARRAKGDRRLLTRRRWGLKSPPPPPSLGRERAALAAHRRRIALRGEKPRAAERASGSRAGRRREGRAGPQEPRGWGCHEWGALCCRPYGAQARGTARERAAAAVPRRRTKSLLTGAGWAAPGLAIRGSIITWPPKGLFKAGRAALSAPLALVSALRGGAAARRRAERTAAARAKLDGAAPPCRAPSSWTRWCCARAAAAGRRRLPRRLRRPARRPRRSSPTPCTPRTRYTGSRPPPGAPARPRREPRRRRARPACSACARSAWQPPRSCTRRPRRRRRPPCRSSRQPSRPSAPSTALRPWPQGIRPEVPLPPATRRPSTRAPTRCPTPGISTAFPLVSRNLGRERVGGASQPASQRGERKGPRLTGEPKRGASQWLTANQAGLGKATEPVRAPTPDREVELLACSGAYCPPPLPQTKGERSSWLL